MAFKNTAQFCKRSSAGLTPSDWVNVLLSVVSLVISFLTFRNASDTSDLRHAVASLSALASETRRQADATQGQLIAVQDEQRAWVSVNFLPGNITDSGSSYIVHATFALNNPGHTPAFYTPVVSDLEVIEAGFNLNGIGKKNCADTREKPLDGSPLEDTLFPGGSALVSYNGAIRKDKWLSTGGEGNTRAVVIYGCVNYRSNADRLTHQTKFTVIVGEQLSNAGLGMLPADPTNAVLNWNMVGTSAD